MIRRNVYLIFLFSLFIRLAIWFVVYPQPIKFYSDSDAYNYENIAFNLMEHGEFSGETQPPLEPNYYRTPVYPIYVAGVYSLTENSVFVAVLIQLLIGSVTPALMLVLADILRLSSRVGWSAGLLLAIDPLVLLTNYQLITETMFTFLLVLGIVMLALYFRNRSLTWAVGSGIILALATLTRPISYFLPLALLPLGFVGVSRAQWTQVARGILVFLTIYLFMTNLWAFRNYREIGVWKLSAIGEKNLLYYRAREVLEEEQNKTTDEVNAEIAQLVQTEVDTPGLTTAQEIEWMREQALDIFRQYPVTTLKVHVLGLAKVMVNPGFHLICMMTTTDPIQIDATGGITSCESGGQQVEQARGRFASMNGLGIVSAVLEIILLAIFYVGSALGVWKLLRSKQWYLLGLVVIPIIYFSILSAGGESVSRFRIPIVPFLALLAGIGLFQPQQIHENVVIRQELSDAKS